MSGPITIEMLSDEAIEAERHNDKVAAFRKYKQIIITPVSDPCDIDKINTARNKVQELRPYVISVKRAVEAHKRGEWQEEINIWKDLLHSSPPKEDLAEEMWLHKGSLFNQLKQFIQRKAPGSRYLPVQMSSVEPIITERIQIAEQNQQHSDLYKKAQEEVRNQNLGAAKTLLLRLWKNAPYYGDPTRLARTIGMWHRAPNYEEAKNRRCALKIGLHILNNIISLSTLIYIFLGIFSKTSFVFIIYIILYPDLILLEIGILMLNSLNAIGALIMVSSIPSLILLSISPFFIKEIIEIDVESGKTEKQIMRKSFSALSVIATLILLIDLIVDKTEINNVLSFLMLLFSMIFAMLVSNVALRTYKNNDRFDMHEIFLGLKKDIKHIKIRAQEILSKSKTVIEQLLSIALGALLLAYIILVSALVYLYPISRVHPELLIQNILVYIFHISPLIVEKSIPASSFANIPQKAYAFLVPGIIMAAQAIIAIICTCFVVFLYLLIRSRVIQHRTHGKCNNLVLPTLNLKSMLQIRYAVFSSIVRPYLSVIKRQLITMKGILIAARVQSSLELLMLSIIILVASVWLSLAYLLLFSLFTIGGFFINLFL